MTKMTCLRACRLAVPLMFLIAQTAHAQSGATQTVRVLQTNIHRDIGGSDSNIASQPFLAKEVNYLNPDVWTLQELGGNNVAYNAATALASLKTYISQNITIFGANPQAGVNYFIALSTEDDGFDTTAIVSRYAFQATQAYPTGTHTYPDGGSYNGTRYNTERGLNLANIAVPGTAGLAVFTAHLKALNSSDNAQKRQIEADVDSKNIATWMSANKGEGVVVTGDFNESEDAQDPDNWSGGVIGGTLPDGEVYHPITTMKSPGLADPRPLSVLGNADTISGPGSRFDYTLYSPGTVGFVSGQVFDTKQLASAGKLPPGFMSTDSANASDHLPVLSVFQIAATPEPSAVVTLLVGGLGILFLRRRRTATASRLPRF